MLSCAIILSPLYTCTFCFVLNYFILFCFILNYFPIYFTMLEEKIPRIGVIIALNYLSIVRSIGLRGSTRWCPSRPVGADRRVCTAQHGEYFARAKSRASLSNRGNRAVAKSPNKPPLPGTSPIRKFFASRRNLYLPSARARAPCTRIIYFSPVVAQCRGGPASLFRRRECTSKSLRIPRRAARARNCELAQFRERTLGGL